MKIDQIAFGCATLHDVEYAQQFLKKFGATEWSEDHVVASGFVYGEPAMNAAHLFFNYQFGVELELLCYTEGPNWLSRKLHPGAMIVPSHIGVHVDAKAMKIESELKIVQEVYTITHTNPVIAGKRTYHYKIFGTDGHVPFDIKLIERMNVE